MKTATRTRYKNLSQCRSCQHDTGRGCNVLTVMSQGLELSLEVESWMQEHDWRRDELGNQYPSVDATGCPGWELREELKP